MPRFGKRSKNNLAQCHPLLKELANEAIQTVDFAVICGYRGAAAQEEAYRLGNSRARYGQSAHNTTYHSDPYSLAFDACPWHAEKPNIRWDDIQAFENMVEHFEETASEMGIAITCGGRWRMRDWPHVQLASWRDVKAQLQDKERHGR